MDHRRHGKRSQRHLTITATVKATGPYANTATVTAIEPDPDPLNNTQTSTPVPGAQANMAVTKAVNNAAPLIGSNVVFTVTASNAGPNAATGVSVSDALPAGYTFVSASASAGTYTSGTGVWTIGSLANGGSATLIITATVKATGPYANTATITASEPDPDPLNNTQTVTVSPISQEKVVAYNIFAPNGDGKNETLIVPGLENYPGSQQLIYNRWGNEVYKSNNYKNDWDGSRLNEGTYYYVLNRRESTGKITLLKGWVFLKR